MSRFLSRISSEKGITLIEIVVSIVLLSIILISFSALFVQSAQSNTASKQKTEATYIAQSEIEKILNIQNKSNSVEELITQILDRGYKTDSTCTYCYMVNYDDRLVSLQITDISDTLGKILLKVFEDESKTKLEAQIEVIISWAN